MTNYYLYILKCCGNTLYTGITTDLSRRLLEHQSGTKGAKYTAAHRPVELVYQQKFPNRSLASIEEARVKKMNKEKKLLLIANASKNLS